MSTLPSTLLAVTMRVAELWRYPVKSLRGERLAVADVAEDGIVGDRLAHVRQQSGRVVTSRFRPGLLGLQASLGDDGEPLIDGLPWASAAARGRSNQVETAHPIVLASDSGWRSSNMKPVPPPVASS